MPPHPSRARRLAAPLALALALGCTSEPADTDAPPVTDFSALAPVSGVVTLNGKPLPHAVVTVMPGSGIPANAETDAEGHYEVKTGSTPGATVGKAKVAVSYMASADGEPQGLGPRSALAKPPSFATAKEYLPTDYSDLGRTMIAISVPPGGIKFDVDVKAPDVTIPAPGSKPPAAAEKSAAAKPAEPATEKPAATAPEKAAAPATEKPAAK